MKIKKFFLTLSAFALIAVVLMNATSTVNGHYEPFSTTEPWATIVEANIDFPSIAHSNRSFDVYVVRSDGTWVWYKIHESGNDPYSRYFRVYVDGIRKDQYPTGIPKGGDLERQVYCGVLSPGWHTITIEIYYGGYGHCYYLDWLKLGGGNYIYPNADNAMEDHTYEIVWDSNNWDFPRLIKMYSKVIAPGHLVYDPSANVTKVEHFSIYVEVKNTGAKINYPWPSPDDYYCARHTEVLIYGRVIDTIESNPVGARWINIENIDTLTSGSGSAPIYRWSVGVTLGGKAVKVGASISGGTSSDTSASSEKVDTRDATPYHDWLYFGKAWADFSPGLYRNLVVEIDLSYTKGNAEQFLYHNIQFKVVVRTKFYVHYIGWLNRWIELSHTYIIGDGAGDVGSGFGSTDRWITVLPGTWAT